MKKSSLLIIFFLSLFKNLQALEIIGGPQNILKIANRNDVTEIYVRANDGTYLQLFSNNTELTDRNSNIGVAKDGNLYQFMYTSNDGVDYQIIVNLDTKQVSQPYSNLISYNSMTDPLGVFYKSGEDARFLEIKPLFQPCKNPQTVKLKAYPNSTLGPNTTWVNNETLYLDYATLNASNANKKIIIKPKNIIENCANS